MVGWLLFSKPKAFFFLFAYINDASFLNVFDYFNYSFYVVVVVVVLWGKHNVYTCIKR